jgi:hypothetical protein
MEQYLGPSILAKWQSLDEEDFEAYEGRNQQRYRRRTAGESSRYSSFRRHRKDRRNRPWQRLPPKLAKQLREATNAGVLD